MSYNNTTQPSILNVTEETLHQVSEADIYGFWIGFSLAIFSNAFTGSSYIVKKLGLNRVAKKQEGVLPDHDGYGYLKEWLWWVGMSLMIFGEILNFLAYIFAPATLVTPLGALSVIVTFFIGWLEYTVDRVQVIYRIGNKSRTGVNITATCIECVGKRAVMSSIFLKERLNIIGKVSCGLCVIGSTVMVVHSPQETQVHSMDEMLEKVQEPIFIVYCLTLLGVALVFIIILAPKYGGKYVLVYQAICGILGSFTVMGSKGTGIAISQTVKGDQQFTNWFTYVNLAIVIACILVELNFLNRSLAKFNTAVVIPINYVLFTSFVVSLSAVLFKDFFYMNWKDIVSFFLGFIIVVGGIFLLNSFKDMDITMKNLPKAHKKEIEKDETINILVNGNIKNTNDTYRKLDNSQSIASIDQIVFETK